MGILIVNKSERVQVSWDADLQPELSVLEEAL